MILTRGGAEFVTPLSFASISGEKVYQELFSLTDEAEMGHIRLSREADLVVVAPASADLMAKMAHGLADDLASTTLLATDKPVHGGAGDERDDVGQPRDPGQHRDPAGARHPRGRARAAATSPAAR